MQGSRRDGINFMKYFVSEIYIYISSSSNKNVKYKSVLFFFSCVVMLFLFSSKICKGVVSVWKKNEGRFE